MLKDNEFWNNVELHRVSHPLHSHRYFDHLFGPRGDLKAIRIFQEQFFTLSGTFQQCLGGLISLTDDQSVLGMLSASLFEEVGRGDVTQSGLEPLKRFARSIGYSRKDIGNIRPLRITQETARYMVQISRSDFWLSMGAILIGVQFARPILFQNICEEFRKKNFLSIADLSVYATYAEENIDSREEMKSALSRLMSWRADDCKMLGGIELSEILFYNLWEGVGEASGFYSARPRHVPFWRMREYNWFLPGDRLHSGEFYPSC